MTIPEKAVQWAVGIANDNSHGYDQNGRWGPDYDCSALVISAYDYAGTKVKANGATYTGNMYNAFINSGFTDVTSQVNRVTAAGMLAGDVLLNVTTHTAMYIGNGQLVHASGNENGGIVGGRTGDQTGREICVTGYFNFPWNYVLRYAKSGSSSSSTTSSGSSSSTTPSKPFVDLGLSVGQSVFFNGSCHYASSDGDVRYPCKSGAARVTGIARGGKHPYHLISTTPLNGGVYGWVDADTIEVTGSTSTSSSSSSSSSTSTTPSVTPAVTPAFDGTMYTVQPGDNLSSIAYKLLGDWLRYRDIKQLNGLTSDLIYPGQMLKIPKK